MLRRLEVFARTHLPWISLVALGSTATYFWLHLEDHLGLELHGAALLPELDARPGVLPVASHASSPASDCTGIERGTTAASSSAAAGPAR